MPVLVPRRRRTFAALLLALVAVLFFWLRPGPRAAVAEDLRDRLAQSADGRTSPGERQRIWHNLQEKVGRLPPADREAFWAGRRQAFRDWLEDFFRAPPAERRALLDREIDRMEAFRRAGSGAADALPAGPPAGAEELEYRRRMWLALTTAEERVQAAAYMTLLAGRRQDRGLPPGASPWGDDESC